jgi:hypothetical protein
LCQKGKKNRSFPKIHLKRSLSWSYWETGLGLCLGFSYGLIRGGSYLQQVKQVKKKQFLRVARTSKSKKIAITLKNLVKGLCLGLRCVIGLGLGFCCSLCLIDLFNLL